jgi:hypothetical protein
MAAKKAAAMELTISPPNLKVAEFTIRGTAPYVQSKFSNKSMLDMMATQQAGSVAKKGKKREAKDFDLLYEQSMHLSEEGWRGIPAPAFRNALISACRVCGFAMTRAKLSVFAVADGYDKLDRTALVKITKGKPHRHDQYVRNASGVADIRSQAMWEEWECKLRIRFDADQFSLEDIGNLLMRAGLQVGVGCGRPDSKDSAGLGYGTFEIVGKREV